MKQALRPLLAALLLISALAHGQDTVRAEIGAAVQAAQTLFKAGKYKEALAKIRESDAVTNRTAYENLLIERMRGAAAAGAGDDATFMKSFEAVLASGSLPAGEKLQVLEALAGAAYRTKDYARAVNWARQYLKEGGTSPQIRSLLTSAHYLSGDYAGVVKDLQQTVRAAETITPVVEESTLRMLAASYAKLGDDAGYVATLDKLLVYHPKKEYWLDRLGRLTSQPGFADRWLLDVYRLRMATATLDSAEHYMEMAQLALEASLPFEAKRTLDAGYAAGKLGVGADADRHKRMRDLTNKESADDAKGLTTDTIGRSSEGLVNTGLALVSAGRWNQGIQLMESGLAKGGLKRPDEARLHLAQAYLLSGSKAKAIEVFKSVKGGNGLEDLSRLWVVYATRS